MKGAVDAVIGDQQAIHMHVMDVWWAAHEDAGFKDAGNEDAGYTCSMGKCCCLDESELVERHSLQRPCII